MGKGFEQSFIQRRYTNGQQAYEKMLSVTNYQRNVNQNNNQISPHTFQDAYCQKKEKTENNKH